MIRIDNRDNKSHRPIQIERQYTKHADGSVLISYGDTKVLCTAFFEEGVPPFLRNSGQGWITAEYSLLPSSTHTRARREVNKGKLSGRTNEIQRLIGRSLRSIVSLDKMGENTLYVDADVIQADGGTRTAAITGCMIALYDAFQKALKEGTLKENPIVEWAAAISVGIFKEEVIVDLCYEEDSKAETDMNIVMTESGRFVEIQGTAEQEPFSKEELDEMLGVSHDAIQSIIQEVKNSLNV